MKILYQYALRSLRLNRMRTLVTIIGIILSAALFTAVTVGAYSGQHYLIDVYARDVGAYTVLFPNQNAEQMDALAQDPAVSAVTFMQDVGFARAEGASLDQSFIYVAAMAPSLDTQLPIHVTAGRLPETDAELILPEHLLRHYETPPAVGSTLTLTVGERQLDGRNLSPRTGYRAGETLENTAERSYTVVGYYSRLPRAVEPDEAASYTALTAGSGSGSCHVFVQLAHPERAYRWLAQSGHAESGLANSDLLYCYGVGRNNTMLRVLYGLMAILLGLIMFGSVALIYNSFSISVSERTKQFGLLKSLGATTKQVRRTVLFEAALLCIAAVPLGLLLGCAGIGMTLRLLRGAFSSIAFGMQSDGVAIRLHIAPWTLLLPAVIGLLTVLISAWLPARRAVRLTAIDAIRQTEDVKISGKQVKTSRLVQKYFGFSGTLAAKNFKRNRKKYRATVLSLFLSIVLFVSASSFSAYLRDSVNMTMDESGYDLAWFPEQAIEDPAALQDTLRQAEHVDSAVYQRTGSVSILLPAEAISRELAESVLAPEQIGDRAHLYAAVSVLPDETFRSLLRENGLEEVGYFDPEAPLALTWDGVKDTVYTEDGSYTVSCHVLADGLQPQSGLGVWPQEIPGLVFCGESIEDGVVVLNYLEEAYYYGEKETTDGTEGWHMFSLEEAADQTPLAIGARLEEAPWYGSNTFTLFYPESTAPQRALDDARLQFHVRASEHSAAMASVEQILRAQGFSVSTLTDMAQDEDATRSLITIINVFSYGFIVLISLIAAANVFNTISTNISLRRQEFAMLRSVGLTGGGLRQMMNYECLLYGLKALVLGLPASVLVTWLIFRVVGIGMSARFYLPWQSIAVAVVSVFLVVFVTMLYAMRKIRRENPMDALRSENL